MTTIELPPTLTGEYYETNPSPWDAYDPSKTTAEVIVRFGDTEIARLPCRVALPYHEKEEEREIVESVVAAYLKKVFTP